MADQDYAALIRTFGELRDSAIWASVVLGIVAAICIVVYYVVQYKKAKSYQDAKNNRATKIASSNSKISDSISSLKDEITKLNLFMNGLSNINELNSKINVLTQKVTGTTNSADSINLIKLVFLKAVYFEVRDSLNEWLIIKESDFKHREQFIANSIRTNIGEILNRYKGTLSEFELSVNYNLFFRLSSSESVERYILVDIIWSEIKDYFVSQLKYEQRVEECSLKLFNIIKDYVNTITSEIKEENLLDKSEISSRSFRTPVPFKMPEN